MQQYRVGLCYLHEKWITNDNSQNRLLDSVKWLFYFYISMITDFMITSEINCMHIIKESMQPVSLMLHFFYKFIQNFCYLHIKLHVIIVVNVSSLWCCNEHCSYCGRCNWLSVWDRWVSRHRHLCSTHLRIRHRHRWYRIRPWHTVCTNRWVTLHIKYSEWIKSAK